MPTSSIKVIKDLKGVKNYFIGVNEKYKAFKTNKCTILNPEIISIDNNTVVVTGLDEFEKVIENEKKDSFNIKGRQYFIFTKEKNTWKIIHHHRSRLPKKGCIIKYEVFLYSSSSSRCLFIYFKIFTKEFYINDSGAIESQIMKISDKN